MDGVELEIDSAQTEKSTLPIAVINSPKVVRRISSMYQDSLELESTQSDRFSPTSEFQSLLVASLATNPCDVIPSSRGV